MTMNPTFVRSTVGNLKQRQYERQSRQRRTTNLLSMRQSVDKLERAVLIARTLDDVDAVWEDFLDPDTRRTRRFVSQYLQLAQEAQKLQLEQVQLHQLLAEHRLSTKVLTGIMTEHTDEDWNSHVKRLHELELKHFKPWTLDMVQDEIDATLKEVNSFEWSTDKHSSNATVFGWRDVQRFDSVRSRFQFEFSKTFENLEMMDYVHAVWDAFTHGETSNEYVIGRCLPNAFEVLQQLGPNIMIVRVSERYPGILGDVHVVHLVFRVRIEDGFLQGCRTLCCPELVRAFGPADVWPSNSMWHRFERLKGKSGYHVRNGGTMVATDVNFPRTWLREAYGTVLRVEGLATGKYLVQSV